MFINIRIHVLVKKIVLSHTDRFSIWTHANSVVIHIVMRLSYNLFINLWEPLCPPFHINKSHLEAFVPGQQSLIMMTSNSRWLRIYQNIKGCGLIQATLLKTGVRTLYHHRCLELQWNVEIHGGTHGKNNEKIAARKRNKLYPNAMHNSHTLSLLSQLVFLMIL